MIQGTDWSSKESIGEFLHTQFQNLEGLVHAGLLSEAEAVEMHRLLTYQGVLIPAAMRQEVVQADRPRGVFPHQAFLAPEGVVICEVPFYSLPLDLPEEHWIKSLEEMIPPAIGIYGIGWKILDLATIRLSALVDYQDKRRIKKTPDADIPLLVPLRAAWDVPLSGPIRVGYGQTELDIFAGFIPHDQGLIESIADVMAYTTKAQGAQQ